MWLVGQALRFAYVDSGKLWQLHRFPVELNHPYLDDSTVLTT